MMEKLKEVSAFFPAYEEEANIEKTVLCAEKTLEKVADKYEILVIDDGSKDKTGEIVKKLASRNNNIRLITHKENKGYGHSLRSGFKNAKYKWITFADSDGQFDFSEFPNFISAQKKTNADLVIGYYKQRQVSVTRKLNSFFWQLLVRILFGLNIKHIDCGFKLIRKRVIDSMDLKAGKGAFISTEFLVKAKSQNFKIIEIPVTHYARKDGKATGADFKVILNSFKDLYNLKKKFLIFCFVGGTSALLSLIMFNFFFWIRLGFVLSVVLGIFSALLYNFLMNRSITFKEGKTSIKKQWWKQGVVYFVSQGINLLASVIMVSILGEGTLRANISVITGIAVSIPFSFFGSLLWTFKQKRNI